VVLKQNIVWNASLNARLELEYVGSRRGAHMPSNTMEKSLQCLVAVVVMQRVPDVRILNDAAQGTPPKEPCSFPFFLSCPLQCHKLWRTTGLIISNVGMSGTFSSSHAVCDRAISLVRATHILCLSFYGEQMAFTGYSLITIALMILGKALYVIFVGLMYTMCCTHVWNVTAGPTFRCALHITLQWN